MRLTQHKLIIEYVKKHGSILPAKMAGSIFMKTMFGSEVSKRARELRAKKLLYSLPDGRFMRFYPTKKLEKMFVQ